MIPGTRLLITSTIRLPHLLLLDLETNKIEDLGISGHSPAYSPTGHILYTVPSEAQGSDIWALPFSLQTRKATGPPFPAIRAAGLASVSNDGLIVCTDSVFQRVVLRDREGKVSGIVGVQQPHMYEFSVSRDGKRLATVAVSDGSQSIWIHDLASGVKKRLTADSANEWAPKWSADGKSVAYTSEVHGEYRALIREVASGAVTVVQPATKERTLLEEWSADGQFIFFTEGAEDSRKAAYFRLRPGGNGYEAVTLQEKSARYPRLSPNGRFYLQSAGQYDLVVRPFPSGPESWQVSLESGVRWPRWSRDGREIYFVWNGGLMAAEVSTQGAFSSSRPKMLFRVSASVEGSASASRFEIMPDGSFAFIDSDAPAAGRVPSIRIIENWHPNSGAKPE